MNKVFLKGNITRDPESRTTHGGTAVADFTLAVNERIKAADGTWQDKAGFFGVMAYGLPAEQIARFFAKGSPILIEGKLAQDSWEDTKTGEKRHKTYVKVITWEFCGPSKKEPAPAPAQTADTPAQSAPLEDADDIPF